MEDGMHDGSEGENEELAQYEYEYQFVFDCLPVSNPCQWWIVVLFVFDRALKMTMSC